MTTLRLFFVASLVAACTGSVQTTGTTGPSQPPPPTSYPVAHDHTDHHPAPAPAWDSTGWTLLGTQQVNGRTDRDTIRVAKAARWDKLTIVVTDSDLDLLDFTVLFANGERWSPKLKHIELLYKNLPGGGAARVEVYGKDVRNRPPVEPPPVTLPVEPVFDPAGWTLLGSQSVDGKKDRDTYYVGKKKGRFDRVVIVVKDSDLEMLDFVITFENGQKFEPKLTHKFHEGQRSRSIDLPKSDRYIKQIDVKYANTPGGGKARVELYGKDTNEGADPGRPKGTGRDGKDEAKDPKDPKYKPRK
jgi:hypothetical protein